MKTTNSLSLLKRPKANLAVMVGEFHMHIDAQTLSTSFERFLVETQKFWNSDFSGQPEGQTHCPPKRHLTKKTKFVQVFWESFNGIIHYLDEHSESMKGYIEAEYIPWDIELQEKPFNPEVKPPFKLQLMSLPPGTFRQDEIHITLEPDKSDPRLLASLRDMGFYSVYMEKPFGKVEIFTAQGTRRLIRRVFSETLAYLKAAGGAVNCSIKEERILRWWSSSPDCELPHVISSVES